MEQFTIKKQNGECEGIDEFLQALRTLRNGIYTIIVKRRPKKRTISQNRLMWLWLAHIQKEEWDNIPATKEEWYGYYVLKFLTKPMPVGDHMEQTIKTTSHLKTEEMAEFLNNIQLHAATVLGISLPNPDDKYFEYFYNEYIDEL